MATIPSPCVRNCCLDPRTDVCLGCYRSLDEILLWHGANDIVRQEILERATRRREATPPVPPPRGTPDP